jgi:hypothetical protein
MKITRVLVANRGEIAVRVIRTLKKLGIESVLAVSTADKGSMGARLADRAVCIGSSRASDSYLRIGTLIEADTGFCLSAPILLKRARKTDSFSLAPPLSKSNVLAINWKHGASLNRRRFLLFQEAQSKRYSPLS